MRETPRPEMKLAWETITGREVLRRFAWWMSSGELSTVRGGGLVGKWGVAREGL